MPSRGAQLVLDGSGRKLAYSRLRVVDATGKELAARLEVIPVGDEVTSLKPDGEFSERAEEQSLLTSSPTSGTRLAVVVADTAAVYPVRIDPTFSDANWTSMGGFPGADNTVSAALVDGDGNLYVGGNFTIIGTTVANSIAKWDGSAWLALGSGMNSAVSALAMSGSTLYAGGSFTTAGGNSASGIASWYGSMWSALGGGVGGIYLNPLDHVMARKGWEMIRYADDFIILCKSQEQAQQALQEVRQWVEPAGLILHPTKTRIVDASQAGGFDFLGYHFERGMKWPREKSLAKFKETQHGGRSKLPTSSPRGTG